jgi:hypothetical protein
VILNTLSRTTKTSNLYWKWLKLNSVNSIAFILNRMGLSQRMSSLAYFQKIKVGLSNHQPVCLSVSPTNNFWTEQSIFMKFGRQVLTFKVTLMQ